MIQERRTTSRCWSAWLRDPLVVFLGVVLLVAALRHLLLPGEPVNLAVPPGAVRMCLSLRAVANLAQEATKRNQPLPAECDRLGGLNFPEGFLLDNRNGPDVVLVGLRWTNRPPLFLDDLVVNIRNVWQSNSSPFCSLDPQKKDVIRWKAVWQEAFSRTNATAQQTVDFLRTNMGAQMVVVGGIGPNSHHAHVMIDADYHMKKVSQGHVQLPGVSSFLSCSVARDLLLEARGHTNQTAESKSRFWFQVREGDLRYAVDKGITWISRCRMVVSTEKQATKSDGELYDVEEDDPDAIKFAAGLSQALPKLGSLVPDYGSLEALFRLRALLLSIRSQAAPTAEQLGLPDFLPEYRFLHESAMPPSLPGLVNYHERRWTNEVVKGRFIHQTVHRSMSTVSGGVSMRMPLNDTVFSKVPNGVLQSLTNRVLNAKPSPNVLTWTVPTVTGIFQTTAWRVLVFLLLSLLFLRPRPGQAPYPAAQVTPVTSLLNSIFAFSAPYLFPFLASIPGIRPMPTPFARGGRYLGDSDPAWGDHSNHGRGHP